MHCGVWLHGDSLTLLFASFETNVKTAKNRNLMWLFCFCWCFYLATHFAISLYSLLVCFTFICFSAHVVVLHTFITCFLHLTSVWTPLQFFVTKVRTKSTVIYRGKYYILFSSFSLPCGLGVSTLVVQTKMCLWHKDCEVIKNDNEVLSNL